MTVRQVRLFGDPVLRTRADEVASVDLATRALIDDMLDTMDDEGGIGLAAPQIGVGARVLVFDVPGETGSRRGHLINPVVEVVGDETDTRAEGCLSIPGVRGNVVRPVHVVARGVDVDGAAVELDVQGLLARCIQHEVDHLDGVLYLDRMDPVERRDVMREIRASEWFGKQFEAGA